jgi:hypothetical protein
MQSMLNKIFDGINRVKINQETNQVEAMQSREKEEVPFIKQIKLNQSVEKYLD